MPPLSVIALVGLRSAKSSVAPDPTVMAAEPKVLRSAKVSVMLLKTIERVSPEVPLRDPPVRVMALPSA